MSFNGGLNWAANFKISSGVTSCRAATIGNDGNKCGDYISKDFYDGKLVTAWSDSSNFTGDNPNGTGGLDVYFSSITAAFPEPSAYVMALFGVAFVGWSMKRLA